MKAKLFQDFSKLGPLIGLIVMVLFLSVLSEDFFYN